MNVVLIISDTLRRDRIGAYGARWMHTPNMDRLASQSFVFDDAYVASFPTVPARKDLLTGRYCFTYDVWSPLGREEVILPECLRSAGYVTQMINDTPHISQNGFFFDRGFDGWIWIRGQENDRLRTDPLELDLPCDARKLRGGAAGAARQHLRNTAARQREAECFCAQTFSQAADWLERNYKCGKFFLYVDTFDPHEPWDAPQHYVDLYDAGYRGESVIYPRYDFIDYLSPAELRHAHALYCAEVTLVDRWLGHLLRRLDELGLSDKTVVILTSDHGFYHGEHRIIGKAIIRARTRFWTPLWQEVARVPLMIRLPRARGGRRIRGYVQMTDLMPTILELAGAEVPRTCQGRSLLPLLRGRRVRLRRAAISSPCFKAGGGGCISTITMGRWSLLHAPPDQTGGATTAEIDMIERQTQILPELYPGPLLYDLREDPQQRRNLYRRHRDVARRLHAEFLRQLEDLGTDESLIGPRRVLS
ncbi:MAG: sulfatase [Phycisphaerae bacterium]